MGRSHCEDAVMNELEWRVHVVTPHIVNPPEKGEKSHVVRVLEQSNSYGHWEYKAFVGRRAPRKWEANIINYPQEGHLKTFRTLKAAKAYALAIVRLNQ